MMASPIYLSIVPRCSMMALESGVSSRFMSAVRPDGLVLVPLGNRREAANVAEQNGHILAFTAKHQTVGPAGQLLDELRRKVLPEGATDSGAPFLLACSSRRSATGKRRNLKPADRRRRAARPGDTKRYQESAQRSPATTAPEHKGRKRTQHGDRNDHAEAGGNREAISAPQRIVRRAEDDPRMLSMAWA